MERRSQKGMSKKKRYWSYRPICISFLFHYAILSAYLDSKFIFMIQYLIVAKPKNATESIILVLLGLFF